MRNGKVVIAGGTGFLGRALSTGLMRDGYDVVILSRSNNVSHPMGIRPVYWTGKPTGRSEPWHSHLMDASAVINLAGAGIADARWTASRKQLIKSSRIESTRAIVEGIKALPADRRPALLLNASAVGYYGPRGDEIITEDDRPGTGFLSQVCSAWEKEANSVKKLDIPVVLLRIGIVLAGTGGALPKMLLPFRLFIGGPLASGRQWWSWIHIDDVIGIIRFLLTYSGVSGPVNLTAPNPVTNREFAAITGKVLDRPSWLPVPATALRLLLGEMADEMLLTGQRVIPKKMMSLGYTFRYPDLLPALMAILR